MVSCCSPGSLREAAWRRVPGDGQHHGGVGEAGRWKPDRLGWGRGSCRGKQCAVRERRGILQWLPGRCRVTLRGKLDTYYGLVFREVTLVASVEDGQGRGGLIGEPVTRVRAGESC